MKYKFIFILAEASIEPLPKEINKRIKSGINIGILDETFHHTAMRKANLPKMWKRGRPDIVHRALLTIFDSTIIEKENTRVFLHTVNDVLIRFDNRIRLPRNYFRFLGLFDQLFKETKIPPNSKKPLIEILDISLRELIEKIPGKKIVLGYSRHGRYVKDLPRFYEDKMKKYDTLINIVGGFPKGTFAKKIKDLMDEIISIEGKKLSTSITLCKILTFLEYLTPLSH
ncbi:MAG: hypothetical protein ACP6IP_07605 [Candidatus Njordarchaeia archaeon]